MESCGRAVVASGVISPTYQSGGEGVAPPVFVDYGVVLLRAVSSFVGTGYILIY